MASVWRSVKAQALSVEKLSCRALLGKVKNGLACARLPVSPYCTIVRNPV